MDSEARQAHDRFMQYRAEKDMGRAMHKEALANPQYALAYGNQLSNSAAGRFGAGSRFAKAMQAYGEKDKEYNQSVKAGVQQLAQPQSQQPLQGTPIDRLASARSALAQGYNTKYGSAEQAAGSLGLSASDFSNMLDAKAQTELNRRNAAVDLATTRLNIADDAEKRAREDDAYRMSKTLFGERVPENERFLTETETSRMNARVPIEQEKIQGATSRDVAGIESGWRERGQDVDERIAGLQADALGQRTEYEKDVSMASATMRAQAHVYEAMIAAGRTPDEAAAAARMIGAERPKENVYDTDLLPRRPETHQQRDARSREATSISDKYFGSGAQQYVPPPAPQDVAQPTPPQQAVLPKKGFMPALQNSFRQFGVDSPNPLRLFDEKLFGDKKPHPLLGFRK